MTDFAVRASGLTKSFRTYKKRPGFRGALRDLWSRTHEDTVAANGVSFDIPRGELVGFLGPNGAGKTTTLKMLSGLLYPTSGHAEVLGYTPWKRQSEFKRKFALVMGQKNQLWWDLPAAESLELNRVIYGISKSDAAATIRELSEHLDVAHKLHVMVRELSLGERMKFELIAALLHRPEILFLDEPTIGLDVISQHKVRDFLKQYPRHTGTTTILTSHYMQDIEALCERVIIIDRGRIQFDGPLRQIVDRFSSKKIIEVTPSDPAVDSAIFGEGATREGGIVRISVARDGVASRCRHIFESVEVADINVHEVPIEEVIRQVFSETPR